MQAKDVTDKLKGMVKGSLRAAFNKGKREYKALEKVHGEESVQHGMLSATFAATAGYAVVSALVAPLLTTTVAMGVIAAGVGFTAYKFAQEAKRYSRDFKKNGSPSYERPPM